MSYSNHGMALAAYIAELEGKQSFAKVAANVMFAPLGMRRTYYIEPPDSALAGDLAPGYRCGPSGCEPPRRSRAWREKDHSAFVGWRPSNSQRR